MIGLLAYWRIGLAVGLVAVVALMGWRVSAWHDSHKALPGVRDALAAEVACASGSECEKRVAALVARQERVSQQAVAEYETELAGLRSRPARVVRVCNDRGVQGARAPAGTDGGTAPGGVVSGHAGPDIGSDLYALARRADELSAQCRALIRWNAALAKP